PGTQSRAWPILPCHARLCRAFAGLDVGVGLRGRVHAGEAALDGAAGETVHAEAAGRFTATVEARDDVARHVDDLALRGDAQADARVVHDGRRPGRVEGRLLDLVLGARLVEVGIGARVDEAVVARHRRLEDLHGHRVPHELVLDVRGELGDGVAGEEEALG